jgi:hypothetical protein
MNRDCSDSIATSYELDGRGSIPGRSKIFFSILQCPDQFSGSPILLSNGHWGLFLRPGHEADNSLPFSAEVKNVTPIVFTNLDIFDGISFSPS